MTLFSIDEREHFLSIRFSAADSANAFSLKAARELSALVKEFKSWRKPIVVGSAHPRIFCSGGNLTEYKKLGTKAEGLKVNREIAKSLDGFGAWSVVKIAVVNGDVLGGGMEWLARFDFRWSSPQAVFAFWQRRIGLSPGWGGGAWWSAKIGEDNLRKLLVAAAPLTATEALRENLIDRILPQWQIESELRTWTKDLGCKSSQVANNWSAKKEQKIFSSLWLEKEHLEVLRRWK